MKKSYYMIGIFLLGILLFSASFGQSFAYGDGEGEEEEEPKDEGKEDPKDKDDDGIDDDYEEENKRYIDIWFGDNVVELASIKRSDDKKDIMDLRIGFDKYGLSIKVSFRTMTKVNKTDCEEEVKEEGEGKSEKEAEGGNNCEEWIHELKLQFEVKFQQLIEYVDLNDNK